MSRSRILLACVLCLLVDSADADAQLKNWKKKATSALNKEADEQVDKAIDEAVAIEGHTDSSGDDAYNLDLSKRRAKAVVTYLTANGIDASRLAWGR